MKEIGYVLSIVGFLAIWVMWMTQWKRETAVKFSNLQKTTDHIYMLSNSHMEEQLKLNVTVTARLADLTGDDADIRIAESSKVKYENHQRRQGMVDMNGELK